MVNVNYQSPIQWHSMVAPMDNPNDAKRMASLTASAKELERIATEAQEPQLVCGWMLLQYGGVPINRMRSVD